MCEHACYRQTLAIYANDRYIFLCVAVGIDLTRTVKNGQNKNINNFTRFRRKTSH